MRAVTALASSQQAPGLPPASHSMSPARRSCSRQRCAIGCHSDQPSADNWGGSRIGGRSLRRWRYGCAPPIGVRLRIETNRSASGFMVSIIYPRAITPNGQFQRARSRRLVRRSARSFRSLAAWLGRPSLTPDRPTRRTRGSESSRAFRVAGASLRQQGVR
jgi:hypothetical protein